MFVSLWIIWGLIALQCAWNAWRRRARHNEYRRRLFDADQPNQTNKQGESE